MGSEDGPVDILHIVSALGGGVLTSVRTLSNGFSERGYRVAVFYAPRDELFDGWESEFRDDVLLLEYATPRGVSFAKDVRWLLEMIRTIRHCRPRILHLHSAKAGFLGRVARPLLGRNLKLLYSPRGAPFLQSNHSSGQRMFYLFLERLAAIFGGSIVACSMSEKIVYTEKVGGDISLIENSVPTEEIEARAPGVDGTGTTIGLVGRISEQKNPRALLELLPRIIANGNTSVVWIGDSYDPESDAIKNRLQVAGCEVTGWIRRDELLQRLRTLDICLQLSLWEGMPLSLIEAQLSGVPVVTLDAIGNRDVVEHEVTGYICPNLEEIYSRVIELASDSSLRERMGSRARELALKRFSSDRMLAKYAELYDLDAAPG